MGLFGGGNSSSSSTTQNYNDSKNFNQQDAEGVTVAAGGDVTVLDSGAIGAAFGFGADALDSVDDITDEAFSFGRDSLNVAGDVVGVLGNALNDIAEHTERTTDTVGSYADRAIQQVSSSTRSDTAEVLKTLTQWVAGAVVVMGLAWIVTRGKK